MLANDLYFCLVEEMKEIKEKVLKRETHLENVSFSLQGLSEVVYVKHKTRVMFCCPIFPQKKSIISKSSEDTHHGICLFH